ncbi:MAG: PEP-CTERM sorting domain-containing protein [Chthoniobacterales bacterium]
MKTHPTLSPIKKLLLPFLLCLAVSPGYSSILVEDSFDYTIGSADTTWNGGTGLSGNWAPNASTTGAIVNGLTLGSMAVSGGALSLSYTNPNSGFGAGAVNRTMTVGSITTGDIYMSYLYKFDTASSPLDEVALEVRPTAGGIRSGISENNSSFFTRYGSSLTASSTNSVFKDGTTLLLIFQYPDLGATTSRSAKAWALTASDYNSLIAAGINEANLSTYATATASQANSSAVTFNGGGIFNIVPIARNASTEASFFIDELKIGTTLADVVAVPEPSTMLLTALAFGAIALKRRSRK